MSIRWSWRASSPSIRRSWEAAVVGVPDDTLGEVPCLCVIPTGGDPITLDEVTAFLSERGPRPLQVPGPAGNCAPIFPRGQTMRVNRRRLAERVLSGA